MLKRLNTILALSLVMLLTQPTFASLDTTEQPDYNTIPGLTPGQHSTLGVMQKTLDQLSEDPEFKSIMDELNQLELEMGKCPMSGPEAKVCINKYKKKYRELVNRASEMQEQH